MAEDAGELEASAAAAGEREASVPDAPAEADPSAPPLPAEPAGGVSSEDPDAPRAAAEPAGGVSSEEPDAPRAAGVPAGGVPSEDIDARTPAELRRFQAFSLAAAARLTPAAGKRGARYLLGGLLAFDLLNALAHLPGLREALPERLVGTSIDYAAFLLALNLAALALACFALTSPARRACLLAGFERFLRADQRESRLVRVCVAIGVSILALGNLALNVGKERVASDAVYYLEIAAAMQHPVDTSFREPLTIWVAAFGNFLMGEPGLQVLSTIFLVLSACLLFAFTRKLTQSSIVGGVAALLFILSPVVRVLQLAATRDALGMLLFLALALLTWPKGEDGEVARFSRRRLAAIAALTTLLVMTRLNSLLPIGCWLGFLWLRRALSLRAVLAIVVVAFVAILPYVVHCKRTYGNATYCVDQHARWWRNYEFTFREHRNCPDTCQVKRDFLADTYAGEPITAFDYVFRLRTPAQLASSLVRGYWNLLLSRGPETYVGMLSGSPFLHHELHLYLIYLAGFLAFFALPSRESFLFPLLYLNLLPFTATIEMPPRLFAPLAPYLTLMVGLGAWLLLVAAYRLGRTATTLLDEARPAATLP